MSALGPIDERITTADPVRGAQIADRLQALKSDPDVDGVLTVRNTVAATTFSRDGVPRAEPITLVWDLDFDEAAAFGGSGSGLSGPAPAAGEVVINDELARRLQAQVGDDNHVLHLRPTHADACRPGGAERGLAGAGLGAVVNADVFLAPGRSTRSPRRRETGTRSTDDGAHLEPRQVSRAEPALGHGTGAHRRGSLACRPHRRL